MNKAKNVPLKAGEGMASRLFSKSGINEVQDKICRLYLPYCVQQAGPIDGSLNKLF